MIEEECENVALFAFGPGCCDNLGYNGNNFKGDIVFDLETLVLLSAFIDNLTLPET